MSSGLWSKLSFCPFAKKDRGSPNRIAKWHSFVLQMITIITKVKKWGPFSQNSYFISLFQRSQLNIFNEISRRAITEGKQVISTGNKTIQARTFPYIICKTNSWNHNHNHNHKVQSNSDNNKSRGASNPSHQQKWRSSGKSHMQVDISDRHSAQARNQEGTIGQHHRTKEPQIHPKASNFTAEKVEREKPTKPKARPSAQHNLCINGTRLDCSRERQRENLGSFR